MGARRKDNQCRKSDSALAALPKEAVQRLAAYAQNSQRAIRADWRTWYTWCVSEARKSGKKKRSPLPIKSQDLIGFIQAKSPPVVRKPDGSYFLDLSHTTGQERSASTISRYLSSLRVIHRLAGFTDDPTKDVDVETIRRVVVRGRRGAKPKQPLRLDAVQRILRVKRQDLRTVRDKAIIAVLYCGMLRRSELIGLNVEDVTWDESDGSATITIRKSKTDQGGIGRAGYLAPFAVNALRKWLRLSGISNGPIFRRVVAGTVTADRAILGKEVARIIKKMLVRAGVAPRVAAAYSGHSARIGGAHDLVIGGHDLAAIMLAGGWTSPTMPARYTREIRAKDNAMAKLLRFMPR